MGHVGGYNRDSPEETPGNRVIALEKLETKKDINGWAVYPASQVLHVRSVSGTISDLVYILSVQHMLFVLKL